LIARRIAGDAKRPDGSLLLADARRVGDNCYAPLAVSTGQPPGRDATRPRPAAGRRAGSVTDG